MVLSSWYELLPERHIDSGGEEVEHGGVEGGVPVGHGHGEQQQLGQPLQQEHRPGQLHLLQAGTLQPRKCGGK